MTGPSFAVVCTTIGDGSFLKHYAKALEGANATMYVIPDRKTPKAIYDAALEFWNVSNVIYCPTPDTQAAFLKKLGAPDGFFPWDTDHRRNVGYLMAYESGADIVISVDDDNLPLDGWLAGHAAPLTAVAEHDMAGTPGFWNPCNMLDAGEMPPFPRGYPYNHRHEIALWRRGQEHHQVAINAGLWLGEPDVDAITRIALHPVSTTVKGSRVLGRDTWAPVNSQNTAVRREVIPAYYFFRSPRFGDIYQGYLAQACAKHLGHSVRFGTPVVRHERNEHDLLNDLEAELPDIMALDPWLDWLTSVKIPASSTYADAYGCLSEMMHEFGMHCAEERVQIRALSMAAQMRDWLRLVARLG